MGAASACTARLCAGAAFGRQGRRRYKQAAHTGVGGRMPLAAILIARHAACKTLIRVGLERMPEMLNGKRTSADVVEWRLARPEDGPVWVALTREGRTPLVPREALVEPDQRVLRDQQ